MTVVRLAGKMDMAAVLIGQDILRSIWMVNGKTRMKR